jgi:peptide/nickel transport system substrate-binding protein
VVTLWGAQAPAQRPAEGTLTLGMPFTITPALLNPAETTGQTASILHYALHDALLKPLPGQPMAPALAESWTESPDGRTYEFTLRQGLTFHNGDPFTAADVTFSFGRYQGVFAALLHEKVQAVEVLDPHHVRFVLQAPWPDFLTVYSALVSGAGWIMPQAYTEQVGEAGFQQHPIGLGPYRFVRATPGTELVLEASDHY